MPWGRWKLPLENKSILRSFFSTRLCLSYMSFYRKFWPNGGWIAAQYHSEIRFAEPLSRWWRVAALLAGRMELLISLLFGNFSLRFDEAIDVVGLDMFHFHILGFDHLQPQYFTDLFHFSTLNFLDNHGILGRLSQIDQVTYFHPSFSWSWSCWVDCFGCQSSPVGLLLWFGHRWSCQRTGNLICWEQV